MFLLAPPAVASAAQPEPGYLRILLPKWNFSWCFNLANLDLKNSSQREHLKGRSWVWRIMCSCR